MNYNDSSVKCDARGLIIMKKKDNENVQLSWNIETDDEVEPVSFEIPVIDSKVEPSPLAENYRQSNWLTPTIMSMNTYSNRIFQGILSAWNMKYIQRGEDPDRWNPEKINKMDSQIHFKVNELFKETTENTEMNYQAVDKAISEFNKKNHIQLSYQLKEQAPDVYEAIKNIANYDADNKLDDIDYADIPMFSIFRNRSDDSIYTFKVNKVLIPIFDSITKYFTSLNLKSIQKLKGNNLRLYEYFKQRLGSDYSFEFIMYFEPSNDNQFDNMRYILNAHETDANGKYVKYPGRSDQVFTKTFISNIENLNKTCSDLYIEYKSNGEIDKERYIVKNKKRIGFRLTLYSKNQTLESISNSAEEHQQLTYYKRLQVLYPNSSLLKEWKEYSKNDFVFKPLYNIIEGDKFKKKHFDSMIMNDKNWNNFKEAYMDFCFEYMKAEYYNYNLDRLECNQFKMMYFFLSHGADIYDAMRFRKQHILSWTPDDEVAKYGKHTYSYTKDEMEELHTQQNNIIPDYVKDFLKEIK